jgi:hypothetical protein
VPAAVGAKAVNAGVGTGGEYDLGDSGDGGARFHARLLLRVWREPGYAGHDEGIDNALPVGQQVGVGCGLADFD